MKKLFIFACCILVGAALSAQHQLVFDSTFSQDGQIIVFPATWSGQGLLVQSDGKILAYGEDTPVAGSEHHGIRLVRLTTDGELDTTFNHVGSVVTEVENSYLFTVYKCIQQPDGKILVSGCGSTDNTYDTYPLVVRYNPDGSLDTSFGNNGIVVQAFVAPYYFETYMVLLGNGNIQMASNTDSGIKLYRLTPDGQPDATFGTGGILDLQSNLLSYTEDFAIDAAGTIYILGRDYFVSDFSSTIVKTDPDGNVLDVFPISQELVTGNETKYFYSITIQPDGKLLVGGSSYPSGILIRLNPDGSLDPTFDRDGIVEETYEDHFSYFSETLLQPDNKITVYFGSFYSLGRFNENGSLDYSFNLGGIATAPHPANGDPANNNGGSFGIALQPDGKLLIGATIVKKLYVARYITKPCSGD